MGRTCPHCNSSEIEEDSARGDATCTACGMVLEESNIVSDVQFQEKGGGGFEMVGKWGFFVVKKTIIPSTPSRPVRQPRSRPAEHADGDPGHVEQRVPRGDLQQGTQPHQPGGWGSD